MGKVKQLWQDERDKRGQEWHDEFLRECPSASEEEAWEYARDMQERYDEDHGRFGVGA